MTQTELAETGVESRCLEQKKPKDFGGERNWYLSKEHFMAELFRKNVNVSICHWMKPSVTPFGVFFGFDHLDGATCYITYKLKSCVCWHMCHAFGNHTLYHTLCVCGCHAAKTLWEFYWPALGIRTARLRLALPKLDIIIDLHYFMNWISYGPLLLSKQAFCNWIWAAPTVWGFSVFKHPQCFMCLCLCSLFCFMKCKNYRFFSVNRST